MTLKDAREAYYGYSGKLSDVTRQLSFAGIAVAWIFRSGDKTGGIAWSNFLLLPLACFVAALLGDLLQYAYASAAWALFHRCKEKEYQRISRDSGEEVEEAFKAPGSLNYATNFFFWSKASATIIGHALLLWFLVGALRK